MQENSNNLLYLECMCDDGSLTKDVYGVLSWPEADLHPKGGQVARPRLEGPRIL